MTDDHLAVIQQLYPQSEVQFLASGEVSDVYLVDGTYTVRFPRLEKKRATLAYEQQILTWLDGKLDVAIPRVLQSAPDGGYMVATFVEGEVYEPQRVAAFTDDQKVQLGTHLAKFIVQLNQALDVQTVRQAQDKLHPDYAEYVSYERYYDEIERIAQASSSPVAKKFLSYATIRERISEESTPQIVVHGDLHAGNLVFEDDELSGILDFGDIGPGTIYDELRPMYSMGEEIVQTVIRQLNGAFGSIDIASVREYATMHELSVLLRSNSSQQRVQVARDLLRTWDEYDGLEGE